MAVAGVGGGPDPSMKINSAFMNDLDIVAVRFEHPCRIIARIVFGPSLRCFLALALARETPLAAKTTPASSDAAPFPDTDSLTVRPLNTYGSAAAESNKSARGARAIPSIARLLQRTLGRPARAHQCRLRPRRTPTRRLRSGLGTGCLQQIVHVRAQLRRIGVPMAVHFP